ncbi:WW domain-binding protein 4-like [Lineus longissimus]|uniref:WW domain-binding protein 4-like n=1 Tax=Lineus longissimus TaxID=88925 RepID=UPI002B4C6B23
MSEYWKSNPRKYCDFCKCWIAENKPSIDFHEKGKRHLENVKKKIDTLKKKGLKDAKAQDERSADMAKMERDALEALKRDIANDPSMAAVYGVKIKEKVHTVENRPEGFEQPEETEQESTTSADPAKNTTDTTTAGTDWDEAKSPDGYTYYWNKITGETSWTQPEGYVPPSERKGKKKKKKKEAASTIEEDTVKEVTETTTNGKSEAAARLESAPETLQESATEKTDQLVQSAEAVPVAQIPMPCASIPMPSDEIPLPSPEPVHRAPRPSRPSAYGSWETVSQEEEPVIDYQLPKSNWHIQEQQESKDTPVDTSYTEPPKIKFREKRAAELPTKQGQKPGIVFKKRKIGGAASNARKRDDD